MDQFNCLGIWWLPDNPNEKIPGTLRFSADEGAELSLIGVFGGEQTTGQVGKVAPVILGHVYDQPLEGKVTLRGCWVRSAQIGFPSATRESYFASRLFVGEHIPEERDFLFSYCNVSYSGLPSWADSLTGLTQTVVPSRTGKSHGAFVFSWDPPDPITGDIPGGSFDLRVGAKFLMPSRKWTLAESVRLTIRFDQPLSDEVIQNRYAYPLQNLMTLATDHPNAQVEFKVMLPGKQNEIAVLAARVFDDESSAADLLPHKMLFAVSDLGDRVAEVIGRWIEISERLADACYPYFAIQYKPDSFVDVKFLTVFQSLEIYQRRRGAEQAQAGTAPGDRSEKEHLLALMQEHSPTIGVLFRSIPEAADELIRYRDYIVHRDSDLGDRPDYSETLYWNTQRLMFLMKACLLSELGFSADEQKQFFRRNQMFIHLINLRR